MGNKIVNKLLVLTVLTLAGCCGGGWISTDTIALAEQECSSHSGLDYVKDYNDGDYADRKVIAWCKDGLKLNLADLAKEPEDTGSRCGSSGVNCMKNAPSELPAVKLPKPIPQVPSQ